METVDDETVAAAIDFIKRAHEQDKPFYVWWNGTRMHFRTHIKDSVRGISGQDEYSDAMVEHDMHVGQLLDLLDELGIADNTIVHYSTDNGPHMNTWPDAASSPFFGEKNTNWEGGWRVPSMVRWPGKIEASSISNEIMHHMDWLPTYLAAAGRPNIKEELLEGGVQAIGREYKVHLDGYNFLPHLTGETEEGPRREIFYFADTGELTALRYGAWKAIFLEQKEYATLRAWIEPWTPLRVPLITNLRRDPYERAHVTSNTYYDWMIDRIFFLVPAQVYVGNFLKTFQEFPPRQKPASFFQSTRSWKRCLRTPGQSSDRPWRSGDRLPRGAITLWTSQNQPCHRRTEEMSELIIVTFKGRHSAEEALIRVEKMVQDWDADLDDVIVVTRDENGKLRIKNANTLTASGMVGGSAMGGLTGLLFGAIAGNPVAGLLVGAAAGGGSGALTGILGQADEENELMARIGDKLKRNSSALAMIVWTDRPVKLLNELESFKGEVIETSLSVSDEEALREALR